MRGQATGGRTGLRRGRRWLALLGGALVLTACLAPGSAPDRLTAPAHHTGDAGTPAPDVEDHRVRRPPASSLPPVRIEGEPDALTRRTLDELRSFTSWLERHGVDGYIGEVGWPDDSRGDGDPWNMLAERWYTEADRAGLWVSAWATGTRWGDYPLAAYRPPDSGDADEGDGEPAVGEPNTQARVLEHHLGRDGVRRGIAVAGGSFGDTAPGFSNRNAGVPGEDYLYPDRPSLEYLAGRGFDFVRLDFRWERLQPRLFEPLSAGELGRLRTAVDDAAAAGLPVVLDLHKYGEYLEEVDGVPVLRRVGSDDLPAAALVDFWEQMSEVFADHPGVLAYGLMNEPRNLEERTSPSRSWHTFDEGAEGWSGPVAHDSRRARSGDGGLRIAWRPGATSLLVAGPDDGREDCSPGGSTFSAWVHLDGRAPEGRWHAALRVLHAADGSHAGQAEPLQPGTWTKVSVTPPPAVLGTCRALALEMDGPAEAATHLWLDEVVQEGRLLPQQVWEAASQGVVSALRERGDDTLLMVPGHSWSAVQTWEEQHPRPWIADPAARIRYEAHHYWDQGRSGNYGSYDEELADAHTAGS